jgi:hypothetical protein
MGTAPASMTVWVWSEVPDAMLVRAQAASNLRRRSIQFRVRPNNGEPLLLPGSSSEGSGGTRQSAGQRRIR